MFASAQKAGKLPLRSDRMLAKRIRPAAITAQIGAEIGWHTFPYTYSSMLRQLGVDVVQQELMRHAAAGTTMHLYTQAVSEQERAGHSRVVRLVLPQAKTSEGQPIETFLDEDGKLMLVRSVV